MRNSRVFINGEFEGLWKEEVVAHFKFCHESPGRNMKTSHITVISQNQTRVLLMNLLSGA
jgi:hypothetical protein